MGDFRGTLLGRMSAHERDEGSTLAPGYLVAGEYVVDAVAHEGAGWISYKGHHIERADEFVSITSLRADAPSAGFIEAFARRSQWLADASIPNVPPLLASGVEMGLPVIVTPWVDGPTLRELLAEEGSLSREEALRIIKSVGESLDAMHARRPSVVHQLLSLDNIRIDGITRAARVMDAGVAHALRVARVEDVHAAAKVPNVFRAPDDTVGRTPTGAVDRYALARLAEALLSPIAVNTQLARTIQRGASDLSGSRFPTCAALVQALSQALKDSSRFPALQVSATAKPATALAPTPATTPATSPATSSPTGAAIGAASVGQPPPSIFGGSSDPAPIAPNPPTPSAIASPAPTVTAAAPSAPKPPTLPRPATASPGASAIAQAAKPTVGAPAPPAPPAPKPAPRATKSTLVGVAPPTNIPKKAATSTLLGISAPIVEPVAVAPAAPAPAEPSRTVEETRTPPLDGLLDDPAFTAASPARTETNPFEPEATKTERVEIDPALSDPSLDEEIVVGDNSIIESVSLLPLASEESSVLVAEPAPFELSEPEPVVAVAGKPATAAQTPAIAVEPREEKKPDAGLPFAQTMIGAAPPVPKVAPPPISVADEDPFPAIPPLSEQEKQRQPADGLDVPPLFEMGPPVPAPISPDATSGVAPISLEPRRSAGKTVAIVAAVVLGLGGGIAGGWVGFDRMMRGESSNGSRGVGASDAATNSNATAGHGADDAAPSNNAALAAESDAQSTAANAASGDDASAPTVAMADDAAVIQDAALAQREPEDSGISVAQREPEDSGVAVAANTGTEPRDSGVIAPSNTPPVSADGVLVVAGEPGQSSPDWRTRAGARRAVRERVEVCGENGQNRGTARFEVRFEGATGRVIQFRMFNTAWRGTPVGDCIERGMRSVAVPTFNDHHWDTDYAVPLR